MRELALAFEGALGLITGGIIFLIFAGAVGQIGFLNLSLWGAIYIVTGFLVLVTIGAAAVGTVIGKLA